MLENTGDVNVYLYGTGFATNLWCFEAEHGDGGCIGKTWPSSPLRRVCNLIQRNAIQ
jgi:hypothetical protein